VYNSVIALSCTLTSPKGEFTTIQKNLGFEKLIERKGLPGHGQFQGFPLKEMVKVYVYPDNPAPFENGNLNIEDYISAVAGQVKNIINKAKGRVLILCPAYKDAYIWNDKLSGLKRQVVFHQRGQGNANFNEVLNDNGVLISATAWEGVDISGLSDVIITRIPHLTPNDMFYTAKEASLKALLNSGNNKRKNAGITGAIINEKSYEAFIRLRQGMGRLIRGENDRGNIHILDPRIANSNSKRNDWFEWLNENYDVRVHSANGHK